LASRNRSGQPGKRATEMASGGRREHVDQSTKLRLPAGMGPAGPTRPATRSG
jgi:hypothetical protein